MSKKHKQEEPKAAPEKMIAKKDYEIFHDLYRRVIRAGDDVGDVPPLFIPTLKQEGVI